MASHDGSSLLLNPNPKYADNGQAVFACFSRLPVEVRVIIWRLAIRRNRNIRTSFTFKSLQEVSTERYTIQVEGRSFISKFFRVCSEARHEADRFYRVKIPCLLSDPEKDGQCIPGTLKFNPENDFLQLFGDGTALPYLLYDLKAKFDPHYVGLCKLAVVHNSFTWCAGLTAQYKDQAIKNSLNLQATILQLQEIHYTFVVRPTPQWRDSASWSIPFAADSPFFESIGHDIRQGIQLELQHTFDKCRSRGLVEGLNSFKQFLADCAGGSPPAAYFFQFTASQYPNYRIRDRESAIEYIDLESILRAIENEKHCDILPLEEDEDMAIVQRAFGLWTVPDDTFNIDPQDPDGRHKYELSTFQPILALSNLQ